MHCSKIVGALTSATIILVSTFGNVYAAQGEVVVNGLNIRSGASTDTAVVGKANAGTKLNVTGKSGTFYMLDYNGTTAYASQEYVSILSRGRGIVNTDVLNMRKDRSTSSEVLCKLSYGEELNIVDTYDGWYQILRYGILGYVSTDYVSVRGEIAPVSRDGEARGAGSEVVKYSQNFLGTAYVSGGSSPSGFDCSGFTRYVYKNFGIELPHSSAAQSKIGIEVSRSNIQAGDLLFFNTTGGISHVAIAVNSDKFIHATVPGDVVKYGSLSSSYYNSRFVTARRILR